MKTLFKKKTSKPSKKEKEILPVTNESEKIPKRSIFRRFYTSVFLRNENHIQTLKQSFTQKFNQEQETEDLILFYLLEMNKPEKNPSNLIQAQPQITQIINRNFIANITKELNNVDINIKFFSSFCKEGIPSQCSIIRPISWKLMLAYLPSRKAEWKETLQSKRLLYQDYVDLSFLIKKKNNSSLSETSITEKKFQKGLLFLTCKDHPLSKEKSSNWNSFFSDQKLWDEIEKDTKRTKNNCPFFLEYNFNNSFNNYPNLSTKPKESTVDLEIHYDAITRLLFVFSKQNPELGYVQGMNEIIATLYYCFYNDENRFFKRNCECDVYFVFEKVMAQIKQNFLVGNDRKLVEIEQKTKQFNELFKKFDIKLWEHLKKTNITPEFYFNKWLILLLTQEFEIKHVLCLWDGLIASGKMLEYIIYLCLGVLFSMREALLAGDFSEIMELLQSTSKLDVKVILNLANNIFNENI